ncbi:MULTISPECIES: FAD-dependent monooxygenase [unclassified Streptomyces]|uniref:FAD-dependent monooxygenase n=1 Tax=Streptomyces sp. NBC_01794 TaxID=2975942 RepID=UPI002DD8D677|nr:FAD-dependent monooxygenase [Streptomyces sp. NBC_01750]WSA99710.1 FAD-dependent monooxygenase [Streptomyces sp. NBC_01794]WSD35841.1 FAD-dependent monooxygenase [Streptomyces sp. NBC_01750]
MDAALDAEVIVVGGGPSGLMLAGELRLAGVEVVVLDRLTEPTTESRGLGFTPRTMEVFAQRGLVDRFDVLDTPLQTTTRGHFGGLPLDFGVFPEAHPAVVNLPQVHTETMLRGWVAELGGDLRRGHAVVGLADTGETVEVQVEGPDGPLVLRTRYLVGCDGGRSTVRGLGGFDFPGTPATLELFLADVRGCNIRPRFIGEWLPGGVAMSAPIGDGVDRVVVCERDTPPQRRTEPPAFSEVAAGWQRLTGEDISHGEALWVSAFGDATRLATEYRRGRVLLAGDAAHVHLPAGGLGMNTGIQDAFNLGWKLAAAVRGHAPDTLLDTYHDERHAVGRRLLNNTRAQGLLFLGGTEMQPLRDVLGELTDHEVVHRHLAGMVSGLEIRYPMGPGDHPLLGLCMPDLELADDAGTTTVFPLLRGARGLVLDLADDESVRQSAQPWADRVDVVTAKPAADSSVPRVDAVLVRPDGHVAWAAPGGQEELADALGRWFGAPVTPVGPATPVG